jgi:hypothetical protein
MPRAANVRGELSAIVIQNQVPVKQAARYNARFALPEPRP